MRGDKVDDSPNQKAPWYLRMTVHAILAFGALFFLMPLVWMIATSLKPLSETLHYPERIADIFVARGYRAEIDGKQYEVVLEREIRPAAKEAVYIVEPLEEFSAGELTLSFGPDTWRKFAVFNQSELDRMNAPVGPGMKVLAAGRNRFDSALSVLQLASGRKVAARLAREVKADPSGRKLWLAREWRPADTDTKDIASAMGDVTRAWDVLAEDKIIETSRVIPLNYPVALRRVQFARSLANTLFVCLMVVAGSVISSMLVAYGFAFLEFRGSKLLFGATMATMMIPFTVVMIPIYLLYRNLGWIGTFKPLWVTAWFGSAFFIFLLRQFFLGLPKDLLDAARIDGCSELEILWYMVVPLSRPAIAMVALFSFLGTWKDFMGPLIYLNHPSQYTLSLSLQSFASEHGGTPWHLLMAASTVFSLPLIILFFFAMKTFIRGIAMTGIKG